MPLSAVPKPRASLEFYCGKTLLESPRWLADTRQVMFVSIERGVLYLLNVADGVVRSLNVPKPLGFVVLDRNGDCVIACGGGIMTVDLTTERVALLCHPEQRLGMRYNDGECDREGRLLVGSMAGGGELAGDGKLFQISGQETRVLLDGVNIPNGIVVSPDGETLLFVDSPTREVRRYRYDAEAGRLDFDRTVLSVDGPGVPDGICLDPDGDLWVAEYGGWRVRKWNLSSARVTRTVELPCSLVTSCCVGGEACDSLFITTSGIGGSGVMGGGLYRVPL